MNSRLFESFCEMIDNVPVKAVIKAAEAERRMVEDDIANKRALPAGDATSILRFCEFLSAAASGGNVTFPILPVEHCAFYRRTVRRLVEAGELPFEANEKFDTAFFTTLSKTR